MSSKACYWQVDTDTTHETSCGNVFEFTAGGVEENCFNFCPFCGGSITHDDGDESDNEGDDTAERSIIGDGKGRKKQKRMRKRVRDMINYTEDRPESCGQCAHFQKALTVNKEYFPPRCKMFEIGVQPYAICQNYEEATP